MNIIFDFDGTIADTFEIVIGIFHELTHRDNTLPPDEVERLRGMSLIHAAEELQVRPWTMPFLLIRGRHRMSRKMKDVHAYEGTVALIRELHADGYHLYITSSNSVRNIQEFLVRHEMNTEFIKIYGGVGLLNKARTLRKVVRHNNLDPQDTWYVGDEVRDIEAAKHAGIKVIAVTWGYNTEKILANHTPDVLAKKPQEIAKAVESTDAKV